VIYFAWWLRSMFRIMVYVAAALFCLACLSDTF
jgi:hypothetical protein